MLLFLFHRSINALGFQRRWLNGEISNFDYLMGLNTLAGRSYNDLCQYPIMPWVIAQYSSDTIDLKDPNSFRDLSKPIGAINKKRLEQFLDRYHSCKDEIPPFMYGSHYSTMVGVVLHYLIRLQPFASLHCAIQNGHFDVPDRLFSSIPGAWEHNTTLLSEVKELTPEWFMLPDFLRNVNNFEFGEMQNGRFVNDVELPPWAHSPEEFIRINREALESDFVSYHLHHWIDLIFGYKQRGPHAIEANNVFYYLTYYGAINRDLCDEETRNAIELQIAHFGQCPMQLFQGPHPSKLKFTSIPRPLSHSLVSLSSGSLSLDEKLCCEAKCTLVVRVNHRDLSSSIISSANNSSILDVLICRHYFVCLLDTGHIETYTYSLSDLANSLLIRKTSSKKEIKSDESSASFMSSNVILFDERDSLSGNPSISLAEELENGTLSNPDYLKWRKSQPCGRDTLITVDKHILFDKVRLPIRPPALTENISPSLINFDDSNEQLRRPCPHQFTRCGLLITGDCRGTIRVLSFLSDADKTLSNPKVLCGTFCGHKCRILCLAVDVLTNNQTEVVVSCDVSGLVLIWTISHLSKSKQRVLGSSDDEKFIISRRPQRVFTTYPSSSICSDISCQIGVVIIGSHGFVSIFSIERNERLHFFDIITHLSQFSYPFECTATPQLWRNECVLDLIDVIIINEGYFLLHFECDQRLCNVPILKSSSKHACGRLKYLALFTLMGNLVRIVLCEEPITYLSNPNRDNVTLCGFSDGMVAFLCTYTLECFYSFFPHESCLSSDIRNMSVEENLSTRCSPITSIRLGPNVQFPTVVTITSSSGGLYVRALPDFVKCQKSLNRGSVAQFVQAPIQAVKETLSHAHHYSQVASDAANSFASNAKSFAGETLSKV